MAAVVSDDDNHPLFVKNGAPVKFCLHKSVREGRGQIRRDVERNGGRIVEDERRANVLLIDEQLDLDFFRRRYYSSTEPHRRSLYVEPRGFVQASIRSGTYVHIGPVAQGMPGLKQVIREPRQAPAPKVPRVRVPFTEEDRDRLAYYIATRCPTRDGRMGNSAYKDLERLGQSGDPAWAWAKRHTFHSWREQYKMNPELMDPRIDRYLEQLKDEGHHFGHDRRLHDHRNARRLRREVEEREAGEERKNQPRGQQGRPRAAPQQRPRKVVRDYIYISDDEEEIQMEEEVQDDDMLGSRDATRQPDRNRPHQPPKQPARQQRILEASNETREPTTENDGSESDLANQESSDELTGSDLFGDREYESQPERDFGDELDRDFEFPMPYSPARSNSDQEQDGPPMSTQATLVSSPRVAEKVSAPGPTNVTATQPTTSPPSPQRTVVATQGPVVVQRVRVRASVQPAREAVVDAPYRNTRARSRSIESQSRPGPDPRGSKKRRKGKEVLSSIEEHVQVEEDENPSESNGFSRTDEKHVEELLEDEESDDVVPDLPRLQDVEIHSGPSDSDDAETHATLVREGFDEDEDDVARIEWMASRTLLSRTRRSMATMAKASQIKTK